MNAWLLASTLLAAPPEGAQDNPHFAAAVQAWNEERWEDAAKAMARAYALDPRPEYVFAQAQALRFSGDCDAAVPRYRAFIALDPPADAVTEARGHIDACGGESTASPPPEPSPPPASDPTPVTSPPAIDDETRPVARPWWRDPAGHVLGWSGVAFVGVGAGLWGEGMARRRRGEAASDEQAYRDARRGGATMVSVGIPLVSVGGALVLAAITRFAVVGRRGGGRHEAAARRRAIVPRVSWTIVVPD